MWLLGRIRPLWKHRCKAGASWSEPLFETVFGGRSQLNADCANSDGLLEISGAPSRAASEVLQIVCGHCDAHGVQHPLADAKLISDKYGQSR